MKCPAAREVGADNAFGVLPCCKQISIRRLRRCGTDAGSKSALTPDDGSNLIAAVARTSAESLRRRFFVPKNNFTDRETDFFLNVDFINHVALVAVIEEGDRTAIVGGGRYIVVQPGEAEIAFAIVDH